jgi:hypothetical protein
MCGVHIGHAAYRLLIFGKLCLECSYLYTLAKKHIHIYHRMCKVFRVLTGLLPIPTLNSPLQLLSFAVRHLGTSIRPRPLQNNFQRICYPTGRRCTVQCTKWVTFYMQLSLAVIDLGLLAYFSVSSFFWPRTSGCKLCSFPLLILFSVLFMAPGDSCFWWLVYSPACPIHLHDKYKLT